VLAPIFSKPSLPQCGRLLGDGVGKSIGSAGLDHDETLPSLLRE